MAYTNNKSSNELETKSTPIDADVVILGDSADSGRAKGLTWANIKATLKTYFDTLYQTILVSGTSIKTVNSNSLLGSGNVVIPVVTEDQLKTATISLSSADILALYTTPIELLPAPGAGKINVISEVVFSFTYNGTQYVSGGSVTVEYDGDTVDLVNDGTIDSKIRAAASGIWQDYPLSSGTGIVTTITNGINKAVKLKNATTAFTTGTGTLKLFIKYRILTL